MQHKVFPFTKHKLNNNMITFWIKKCKSLDNPDTFSQKIKQSMLHFNFKGGPLNKEIKFSGNKITKFIPKCILEILWCTKPTTGKQKWSICRVLFAYSNSSSSSNTWIKTLLGNFETWIEPNWHNQTTLFDHSRPQQFLQSWHFAFEVSSKSSKPTCKTWKEGNMNQRAFWSGFYVAEGSRRAFFQS